MEHPGPPDGAATERYVFVGGVQVLFVRKHRVARRWPWSPMMSEPSSGKKRLLVRTPLSRSVPPFLPRTGSHGSRCARLWRKKSAARHALPRSGAREKSIFFFTSDHRCCFGSLEAPWKNYLRSSFACARPAWRALYPLSTLPIPNFWRTGRRAGLAWRLFELREKALRGGFEAIPRGRNFKSKLIFLLCALSFARPPTLSFRSLTF